MNTEKIEKLKKSLSNSKIPADLKPKIEAEIKRLEDLDAKQSEPKEEEKEVKPVAKKTTTRKPRATKSVAKKTSTAKPSQTSKPKRTAMSVAKEIRKDGESWKDAMARASKVMKEKSKTATKDVETELQKLTKLVRGEKNKEKVSRVSDTNLKRDASRKAKPLGARKVTRSGETSNQYGTYKNHLGRKYVENRDKHGDRLAPRYPKNAPLLAEGGELGEKYVVIGDKVLNTHTNMYVDYDFRTKENAEDFAKHRNRMIKKFGIDFAEGGYLTDPNFGNFQTGVFAKGGGVDYYEQLGVYVQGVGSIYKGISMEKAVKIANSYNKKFPNAEIVIVDEKYGDEYDMDGNLKDEYAKGGGIRRKNGQTYDYGRVWTKDHNEFDKGADHEVNYRRKKLANGGAIKNQYAGRTPEDIWNSLSVEQRQHFLIDHFIEEEDEPQVKYKYLYDEDKEFIDEYSNKEWKKLSGDVRQAFREHVKLGQYAKGGGIRRKNGQTYDYGRVWTKDHNEFDKGADHEVNYRRKRFELGGNVVTDLAGHTGGSLGTGDPSMLDGVSGTAYTGLVGETGAMSSGEMFANGGGVKNLAIKDLPNDSSSKQVKYWASYIVTTETEDNEKINSLASIMDELKLYGNVFFEDGFACLGFNFKGTKQQLKDKLVELSVAMKKMNVRGKLDLLNETSKEVYDNLSSGEMFMNGGEVKVVSKGKYYLVPKNKLRQFEEENPEVIQVSDKVWSRMTANKHYSKYELGGGLPSGASQSYMITESLGNPAQHFAKGGGIRRKNGQTYDYGRVWTKDHNEFDKSADHEVNYRRKNKFLGVFAGGGETYNEKASQLKGGVDYYSVDIDLENGDEVRDLTFKSLDKAKKEFLKYSNSMVYDGENIDDIQLVVSFKNGDYENIYLNKGGVMATGGGVDDESPKIYVADLEAYNNGRLSGVWLDLADYNDADELMEAIQDFLKTSGGEEYAIHDVEYIPNSMYSEYMGQKDFEELYEMIDLAKQNDLPLSVVQEVVSQYDASAVDEFYGKYNDAEDFAIELVDEMGIESFIDFEYYLYITDTDRRLLAQDMADSYVEGIIDEDGGNRIIEEAGLDVDEYEEADSDRQEEMLDEAREIVYDEYYNTWIEGLSDPYYFLVEEQGMYSPDDFANATFVRVDYEKLADALEQDYTFIYDGGSLYVFNIR
jgi:antirestriction protein